MLMNETKVIVKNRTNSVAGYKVPDLGVRRIFQPGEKKEISMEELRKLSYVPGGMYLLQNQFIIENKEAVNELLYNVEPEYFYSDEEIIKLFKKGTLAQFLDCLDFAPEGVIDSIKQLAVSTKLNDVQKRQAILEKTGFDVTKAIEIEEAEKEPDDAAKPSRRASTPDLTEDKTSPKVRRTEAAPIATKK